MSKDELQEIKEALTEEITTQASFSNRRFISSGSTLLDLSISGGIRREGGIPCGIFAELYGAEGTGKSSVIAEICSNAEKLGGKIKVADAEGRLNAEYCKKYGLTITDENYSRPETIEEFFELLKDFPSDNKNDIINVLAGDSLSVLSTDWEIGQDSADKRGQMRARIFSQEIRRCKSKLSNSNNLIVCTNQARDDMSSPFAKITTAGGRALKHQASIRLELKQVGKLSMKRNVGKVVLEKVYGIQSRVKVVKSSIDDPYRMADIYIVFDYGIDDLRANLEFLKDKTKNDSYFGGYKRLDKAIEHVEKGGPEVIEEVRQETIELWHDIQRVFKIDRLPKVR